MRRLFVVMFRIKAEIPFKPFDFALMLPHKRNRAVAHKKKKTPKVI